MKAELPGWIWTQHPPIKAQAHPAVKTCADLRQFIDAYASPLDFLKQELSTNDRHRAVVLSQVVTYLLDVGRQFGGDSEEQRLSAWARWARPGDYLALDIRGFKLAGFQYLRMLFGADTVKPDVHICRYVDQVLGAKNSEARAVYLLERAGKILGASTRSIDVAIWTKSTNS